MKTVYRLLSGDSKSGAGRVPVIAAALIFTVFIILECSGFYLAGSSASSLRTREMNHSSKSSAGKNDSLKARLKSLAPRGTYIVVDTARNILYMKNNGKTIVETVVSSGSGNVLTDPSGNRKWVFDTPRGEFTIRSKIKNPSWIKPDWAFIEEGEKVPDNYKDRVENGMMGKYALAFGNGYFIHGTLYTRLLGRNVTHGCIRVGDEALETIYRNAVPGTKVIVF